MLSDRTTRVQELKDRVARFVGQRDWSQFQTPKNLSMALAVEAAELMEIFQWAERAESKEFLRTKRREIEHELADIAGYVLSFCSLYGIDLSQAMQKKMKVNRAKYPLRKSKGRNTKYTEL